MMLVSIDAISLISLDTTTFFLETLRIFNWKIYIYIFIFK